MFMILVAGWAPQTQAHGHLISLSLKEALQKAEASNLQVIMANARLDQAIARISEMQSDLWPHVDGALSTNRQTVDLRDQGISFPGLGTHIGPFDNFDARLRVSVALFDPSAFERFQAAKQGEKLSQSQLEKTREDVLALVAQLYTDAERKQEAARLWKLLLDRDQMAFDLGRRNLNQGTGTFLEAARSHSDLDETKYVYDQAQYQAREAYLDLAAALQLPTEVEVEFQDDNGFLKTLENKTSMDLAGIHNADVMAASSQLEKTLADEKTAAAALLPHISGMADYGRSGGSPGHGSNVYAIGLQATVPIWEGGTAQAQIKESQGQVKEAKANLADAALQEQINIAKAKAAIDEADDLRRAARQKRRTFQTALDIARHSYDTGAGSMFQVMQARANLAQAQDEYNQARATWIMAHINLLHAQGRLRELVQ